MSQSNHHHALEEDLMIQGIDCWEAFQESRNPEQLETAIQQFRQVLEQNPDHPDALCWLARALWEKRDIPAETAIEYCKLALRIQPEHPEAQKIMATFAPAPAQWWNRWTKGLLQVLSRLLVAPAPEAAPPETSELTRIRQMVEGGEFLKALYHTKQCLQEAPDNAQLHGMTAFILVKLDDAEGAVEAYQRAFDLGQDPVWRANMAYNKATVEYHHLHRSRTAYQTLLEVRQLNPEHVDALRLLGEIALKCGWLEEALEAYGHVVQKAPANGADYCMMGYLLWQLDRNNEAIDAYLASLSYDPRNAIAHNNLGVIYLDENDSAEAAVQCFQKASQIDPTYALAYFNCGRAMAKLGRIAEAAEAYSEALALNSHEAEVTNQEVLDRLNQLFDVA
jgi:tetratricopeptide (TPR) repeat protein